MLRIDIISLFPSFFDSPLSISLTAKGIDKGLLEVKTHDLRDFGVGVHKNVDDRPFGGGPGMVLKADVLASCLKSVIDSAKEKPYTILLDPAGEVFDQSKAQELSRKERLILICGHYEGVDERFKEKYVDLEVSVGDYILTGGEVAGLVIVDSVSRLLKGFLGKEESSQLESFSKSKVEGREVTLLDYPVYTRPEVFEGKKVPEILISGDHEKIKQWRSEAAYKKTKLRRPDLLSDK